MKSSTTPKFWNAYSDLPNPVKVAARRKYQLWNTNPAHPSLRFKKVGPFWSLRVTGDYRALSILREETYYWFWIGKHTDYIQFLKGK